MLYSKPLFALRYKLRARKPFRSPRSLFRLKYCDVRIEKADY